MFNQTRLEIKPSIRLAIILTTPCIASLMLILSAQIPGVICFSLVGLHLFISYQFISRFALLLSPLSIRSLQIDNEQVYLEDMDGHQFLAQPLEKNLLNSFFSLISFDCELLSRHSREIMASKEQGSLDQNPETEIINLELTQAKSLLTNKSIIKAANNFIDKLILSKNRRHLIICRYNVANSSAFRRVRVWFKFHPHSNT